MHILLDKFDFVENFITFVNHFPGFENNFLILFDNQALF